ncbi:MAG: hypothetical protein COB90_01220 [Hyphomicrobiales bacterium]|nr:MAG: hypothetical protein COB90_01220 [Hyphomicrobiales bacterium]
MQGMKQKESSDDFSKYKPWSSRDRFVAFLRVVSLAFLLRGLHFWIVILSVSEPIASGQVNGALLRISALFGVLHFIAGVGLWLTAPWGMVMWGVTAILEILASIFHTDILSFSSFVGIFHFATIILFGVLWFFVRRDEMGPD